MKSIRIDSPIGELVLTGTDDALVRLTLPGTPAAPDADVAHGPRAVADAAAQLAEYFAGDRMAFDLPVTATGTAFQREVWAALAEIPYGETISYAELASRVGRPRACRAVGQANGRNPIPIIVPCHRVVASGGRLGGYGGGLSAKRALLALEGVRHDVDPAALAAASG